MVETLTGSKARQAVTYFQNQGWSPAQAAGIVANLYAESGLDEDKPGDNHMAYGIGQWHPDRQDAFRAWAGAPIQGSSFEQQLGFVQHELTKGSEQAAGRALAAADGARPAGMSLANDYERPADPDGQKAVQRGNYAQTLFDAMDGP